jgi:hypothetical protein
MRVDDAWNRDSYRADLAHVMARGVEVEEHLGQREGYGALFTMGRVILESV